MDTELLSDSLSLRDEISIVGAGHVGEAWAEHLHIGPDEWVGEVIDMVSDDHQIPYSEGLIDPSSSIRHQEVLDP